MRDGVNGGVKRRRKSSRTARASRAHKEQGLSNSVVENCDLEVHSSAEGAGSLSPCSFWDRSMETVKRVAEYRFVVGWSVGFLGGEVGVRDCVVRGPRRG